MNLKVHRDVSIRIAKDHFESKYYHIETYGKCRVVFGNYYDFTITIEADVIFENIQTYELMYTTNTFVMKVYRDHDNMKFECDDERLQKSIPFDTFKQEYLKYKLLLS